jgi:protein TonB
MTRLAVASVLALAGHVLFLAAVLPGRQDDQPLLKGIRQVKVRIYHPAPEPVEKEHMPEKKIPVELPEPPKVPAVEKPRTGTSKLSGKPAAELLPAARKKEVQPVVRKARPNPEARLDEDVKAAEEEPDTGVQAGGVEKAGAAGPEEAPPAEAVPAKHAASSPASAAVIREAVPLPEVNRAPEYPVLARRRGWEGTVTLEVDVTREGRAGSVRVRAGSSHALLDEAALEAVRKWRFRPGTENGEARPMTVLVPVHFILKDEH